MVRLTESAIYIRTKCSVESVKKLNLWGCDIDDISICSQMTNLEVLSLSVNRVSVLQPLCGCSRLVELSLRKNNLESLTELEHLKDLKNLRVLWIDDNPCTKIGEYRRKVVKMLPQITRLDDRAISLNDHIEAQRDDCTPEYDMQSSIHSARSSRSGISLNDMMVPCIYGRTIVDTVMEPQMLRYGESIDSDIAIPLRDIKTSKISGQNVMTDSVYGAFQEDRNEEWVDFSIEEEFRPLSMDTIDPRMCTSMVEFLEHRSVPAGRSVSVPRRRQNTMNETKSPAREIRLTKIMSAVSVLLDELDLDGLRAVIEQAQKRMKKQR